MDEFYLSVIDVLTKFSDQFSYALKKDLAGEDANERTSVVRCNSYVAGRTLPTGISLFLSFTVQMSQTAVNCKKLCN